MLHIEEQTFKTALALLILQIKGEKNVTYHIDPADNIKGRSHQANTFSSLLENAIAKHLGDFKS